MNYKQTLILLPTLAMAACGSDQDPQTVSEQTSRPGTLVYAYPADGQREISPKVDVTLRFSHAVTEDEASLAGKIVISDGEDTVDFTVNKLDDGRSLSLDIDGQLKVGSEYTVSFSEALQAGERSIPNPNATGDDGIQFTTRGSFSGIAELSNLSDDFAVSRMIPAEGSDFLPMDFSTFRLQLTQPVHPDWRIQGGKVELLDSDGEPVPASIMVRDRAITIDPCLAESTDLCGGVDDLLAAGKTYTISVQDMPGLFGGTLTKSFNVTPRDTSPHSVLYERVIDSGLNAGESEESARRSLLNGQIVNGITLNSVLQGNAGPSQQTADLFAQIAHTPSFAGDTGVPLRIARNSKLTSTSLDIEINGLVPVINAETGTVQKTGDIKVTMLSDAIGYLLPNPYSNASSSPRHIRLWMDVALHTEEAMPNAALSQSIMGLELTGITQVEDGLLTIDAIAVVEPRLLGLEDSSATIAFRIEADTDADVQVNALDNRQADTTGPELVSWMPGPSDDPQGNRHDMHRPGDPIILNFDEPLDESTVSTGITMISEGIPYSSGLGNLKVNLDGTAVSLYPRGGLQRGVTHTVQVSDTLTDLAGNSAGSQDLQFELPISETMDLDNPWAPMVLSTYPGFPCATEELSPQDDHHGFCIDRPSEDPQVERPDGQPRERLPITTLPKDRPIIVGFSTPMKLDSITTETFVVEKIDPGSALDTNPGDDESLEVDGRLEKFQQQVRFYPAEPWQEGALYRYTLRSKEPSVATPEPQCSENAPEFICSTDRFPLNTDLLADATDIGGPDMTIYFKGSPALSSVFNPLSTLPVRDVNSNLRLDCLDAEGEVDPGKTDCTEPFPLSDSEAGDSGFPPSANAAKVVAREGEPATSEFIIIDGRARVGCPLDDAEGNPAEDCPKNKFIYQTLGLNTEIIGRTTDPSTGKPAVEVNLYPTLIATTPLDVHLQSPLLKQPAGPQILRMRYAEEDDCVENCRTQPIRGFIVENDSGETIFKTDTELLLDAPNLKAKFGETTIAEKDIDHNLYGYPLNLDLAGGVSFFDDGRMQVRQFNATSSDINAIVVTYVSAEPSILVDVPLEIPAGGIFLNLISNPIKEIPEVE